MKKGIIIAIVIGIILVGLGFTAMSQNSDEPIMSQKPVEEQKNEENQSESTGKSIQINLNDGIGAGDR